MYPSRKVKYIVTIVALVSLLLNTLLIYVTGGTPNVFTHNMYLIIFITATFIGPLQGGIIGIIAGILTGPMMTFVFMKGEGEELFLSLYRTVYFVIMGVMVGYVFGIIRKQIKKLRNLNTHDALTGIPNINYYFEKHLTPTLSNRVALTLQINNHEALILLIGNHAYSQVIKQLYESIKPFLLQDTIMVYVDDRRFWIETTYDTYSQFKNALIHHLDRVNLTDGNIPLFFDYSIGTSILNSSTNSMQRFHESDVASMYAKTHNLKFIEYQTTFEQDQNGFKLIGKLPQAVQENDLFLLYQPIIDLPQNKCIGCEALIRWRHEDKIIQPKDFITLAEKTRIINQVTYWVINQIVKDYPTFQEQYPDMQVSMNFSQRNLYEPELVNYIIKRIHQAQLPSHAVEIEITESTLMLNQQEAESNIQLFKAQGIRVILDDFGNEYSSLAFLRDLPVEKIKIDRGFTMNIISSETTKLLVKTIIDLAHGMGFKVVAEGIENEDMLNILVHMGCDYGQGYYYARPMTKEDFIAWLNNRGEHHEKK